ncbi:hypothetical protein B0A56_12855 [Flavobacterium columnare NBRC 100251 = ATCC 23463]|uniref:SMI1/KNR4 family protein n=1 Tax=Flavobacterium columnare TaxID=996 RepID=A0AA94JMV8_9FLAO|nr:SMI1/KNR4 family protein [Flavobacterium columnare]MCH4829576.1 SMI1/KNR4 family protein [Flavobacterium columnare]MCH4831427.1 SMI1/KNR4 family protein [Flavobacterium columnare]OXA74167.1 hypothetical protein B0A56_12855 [Flavobacterium columnare NBRC 100251 = ATCC 23463]
MENSFVNVAKSITQKEIEEVESYIGGTFPTEFKEHYIKFNGGFPVNDRYCMQDYDTYTSINGFIPIKYHYDNNDNWTLEQTFDHFNKKGYLPLYLIAFASDYGGNKFCIDLRTGDVFLVFMDLGHPQENPNAIRKIADNFESFVNNLEEEEEEDV